MRRFRVLIVMLAALTASRLANPTSARAQAMSAPERPRDSACTYLRCSLWIDGGRILQGAHGDVVARRGFFRPLRVLPLVAGDSAQHYAILYERSERRASRFRLPGFALLVAGFVVALSADCETIVTPFGETCRDDATGPIAAGLILGGFTLDIVGMTIAIRGHRSLVRALWWHNSQYAR